MNSKFNLNSIIAVAACVVLLGISAISAQKKSEKPAPPVSDGQRAAIEAIVYDYLLKNPAVVREALRNLETQEANAKTEAAAKNLAGLRSELFDSAVSPSLGKADAEVPIVVFFDYFCGYCRKTLPALQGLIEKDSSVRIVYKELPILGPESLTAAHAALAAGKQGRFAEFHKALFEADGVGESDLKAISDRLRLDFERLKKDMGSPEIVTEIERTARLAETLEIAGTPAYIVGGRIIPGAITADALAKIVAAERETLARAKKTSGTIPSGK